MNVSSLSVMKRALTDYKAMTKWRLLMGRHLVMVSLVVTVCLVMLTSVASAAEGPSKIYSLKEILAEWRDKPMEQTVAAAEKGDLAAIHYLGYYHTEGLGGVTNYVQGREWYLKAAEQKFPNSLNNLGVIYQSGRGVERDSQMARKYFRQAAELGSDLAQENLARELLYSQPWQSAEDVSEGMMWLQKAMDNGRLSAQANYGYLLMYPRRGGKKDPEKAVELLADAARKGYLNAYRWLGDIYLDKSFPGKSESKAAEYYRAGADLNDPGCQSSLGWAYFNGIGVEQSQQIAIEWLLKPAGQKYVYAYYNLGRVYSGEDMPNVPRTFRPDYEKACEWFLKAADGKHHESAYLYGKIICDGNLPWKSKEDAIPVLERAAKAGNDHAKDLFFSIKIQLANRVPNRNEELENLMLQGSSEALGLLAAHHRSRNDAVRAFRFEAVMQLRGITASDSVLAEINGYSQARGNGGALIVSKKRQAFEPTYKAIEGAMKRNDSGYFRQLAQRYLDGKETPKDLREAVIWMRFAALLNDAAAAQEAAKLGEQLDDAQKVAAQKWVSYLRAYQDEVR